MFSFEYWAIFKNTFFEEQLSTAASIYGNLAMFFEKIAILSRRNQLFWVGKLAILRKNKNNVVSRAIQLFSGGQLLSLSFKVYLSLAQFHALTDAL